MTSFQSHSITVARPSWLNSAAIGQFVTVLREQAIPLRFIGGCVRDTLMGREVKDVDACTPLPPEDVTARLEKAGLRVIPTGLKHGTITAMVLGESIQITTLRRDIHCDGRRADVVFTEDWIEDALRRDFTMNALAIDAHKITDMVEIIDYCGGIEDAKAGYVRFIGDASARIEEDYLRVLRFFRFYATHGKGESDVEALAACRLHGRGLEQISGERIQTEMLKLLAAPRPLKALQAMVEVGVDALVMGASSKKTYPLIETLLVHLMNLERQPHVEMDVLLRLALWLRSLEVGAHIYVAQRWRLSVQMSKHLALLVEYDAHPWNEVYAKLMVRRVGRHGAMLLYVRDMTESYTTVDIRLLELLHTWEIAVLPLKGEDIVAAGVPAGKIVGEMLKQAEAYWELHDYVPDKAALINYLSHHYHLS